MVPSKARPPNSPKVQETEFPAGVQGQSPCDARYAARTARPRASCSVSTASAALTLIIPTVMKAGP
ncbi:hypothetical protein Rmf_18170 [Roseomonas fluvialis]|uniref:Uncharacterized protein n=1 Tax=Roseomonas fluvialis TaxID=1750527 RepID=A0ABN6P1M6_9PROT|nr:hypothetical protein Rmf_18170 [Roseomonas fluvialis]